MIGVSGGVPKLKLVLEASWQLAIQSVTYLTIYTLQEIFCFHDRHFRTVSNIITIQTMNAVNNSKTATSTTSSNMKSVRISQTIELHLVRYPDDLAIDELWFSSDNSIRFTHEMFRDVAGLSNVMTAGTLNKPSDAVLKDNVIKCVGLEHLVVARNLPRRLQAIEAKRAGHVHAVLQAQLTNQDIAHTSKVSSSQARSKARFIAQVAASTST
jgi:hypothetical protein